ncbi:hypothetical protein BP5796_09276 [Coleophoma crateriformis]|uniref:AB hydrolase-1 domain-containing protein n=1 Tax=Coleophoma crateriformis TaxID=565419 RepID=A0A3D8R3N7_9HELO|nr:hypothetical protein BP5796_09276 [Coleophoma crateriformis]
MKAPMSSKAALTDTLADQTREPPARPRSVRGAIRKLFRNSTHDGEAYKKGHEISNSGYTSRSMTPKNGSKASLPTVIHEDEEHNHVYPKTHQLREVEMDERGESVGQQPSVLAVADIESMVPDHVPTTPPLTPQLLPVSPSDNRTWSIANKPLEAVQILNVENVVHWKAPETQPPNTPLPSPPTRKKKKKKVPAALTFSPNSPALTFSTNSPTLPHFGNDPYYYLHLPHSPPPTGSLPPLPVKIKARSSRARTVSTLVEAGFLHEHTLVPQSPAAESSRPSSRQGTTKSGVGIDALKILETLQLQQTQPPSTPVPTIKVQHFNMIAGQPSPAMSEFSLAGSEGHEMASLSVPETIDEVSRESKRDVDLTKPTIIIAPGCFAMIEMYESVISGLRAHDYDVEFAAVPSIVRLGTSPRPAAATLEDDVAFIRQIATRLADDGRDILLLGHGYGAFPTNEACRSLTKLDRTARGKGGGVIGLLHIAGFVPSMGQTMTDLVSEIPRDPNEAVTMSLEGSDYFTVNAAPCAPLILHGVPLEEGCRLLETLFGYQSLQMFGCKATFPAWEELPVTYVYCLNDGVNPYPFQKIQVERMQKDARREITLYECEGAHHPNMTEPDKIVRIIRTVAGESDIVI